MCESRTWDALQAIKFYMSASIYKPYYSMSFNSAPSVTHYQLAEILILADPRFEHDIQTYLADRGKFCTRSLQIVHCKLNYIYCLHNACKHDRWASGIFFVFFIHFLKISDGFSTLPKFALPALHFGDFEPCMMCHCQIEWNTTVLENLSCKKYHVHFSLHYHSIQLQLFSSQDLGFPN